MIPQGMTIHDAMQEYQDNKIVITGNDGELKAEGIECIGCHEVHPANEMRYCKCDEGPICESCCSHCDFKGGDNECTW